MKSYAFEIEGGQKLFGSIVPQGAKNEALQILCATLLTADKVSIKNIPATLDILKQIQLLTLLGVEVEKHSEEHYTFCAKNVQISQLYDPEFQQLARQIRGSVMLLGPMLARFNKGIIPQPGGDKIGRRRLDTHFLGFKDLGANFIYNAAEKLYEVDGENMKGCYIQLEEASLTGTANLIMAAVLTTGKTILYNAACEPYIQQLCKMLCKMGAKIEGISSNMLTIIGVDQLNGCAHLILPDMIEIGSFIGMAAMTGSELTIKDVSYSNLGVIPKIFKKIGIHLEKRGDDIYVPAQEHYEIQTFIDGSILTISDAPWPGFTPDLMSIILTVATQAKGSVLIHQKMFESRLFFVDKLIDMGAQIILCDPHRANVIGMNHTFPLRGIQMSSPDIRAGIALLIAALSAQGKSIIYNAEQIDRGYQNLEARLLSIGARIKKIEI